MNDIINILGLEDDTIKICSVIIEGSTKEITIEKVITPMYCPICGCRMHSNGPKTRRVNHPIFQDGYKTVLLLKQRRWICTGCKHSMADEFRFVNKYKHSTSATDFLVLEALKDLNHTVSDVARQFNLSDTQVHRIFERYVDMKRLPLSEVICIDEVHTEAVSYSKYSMIILDFLTGQPIDILPSRQTRDTESYFANIPIEERRKVKYIITDMYNPYLALTSKYFPNAECAIDSYHVVQWILHRIDLTLIAMRKYFKHRDDQLKDLRLQEHHPLPESWVSNEYYLLTKHRWVMLKNQDNIDYNMPSHKDYHFGFHMDTYMYEDYFFAIDPSMKPVRD